MPLTNALRTLKTRYWPLLKFRQTAVLTLTGLAGYFSARPSASHWPVLFALGASLLLAISGSTMLNMWFDRSLDAKMQRTARRPLSAGLVAPGTVLGLGTLLTLAGLVGAWVVSPLCAFVALAGVFFELAVYTLWLKRRTPWSILWGGLAGGMPILAGRVAGLGQVDLLGLLLALAVVLWIPTHNLTLMLLYHEDFRSGGVPTFPACYGLTATRRTVAWASLLAAVAMNLALVGAGAATWAVSLLLALSAGLLGLAAIVWKSASGRWLARLYKYASIYMLGAMLLLAAGHV